MSCLLNYINGQFVEPQSGSYIESFNPASQERLCFVPDSDTADIEKAVLAAKAAYPIWSKNSIQERSRFLNKIADLLEEDLEKFAMAEAKDQGKPFRRAMEIEIPRAVQNFRYFASAAAHIEGQASAIPGCRSYTQTSPVGIVGLISPWNLPLYLLTWKIAPAVVMGNCVVAKPSELTSLTAYMLCEIIQKAGLPEGVINIVFGYGQKAGEAIVKHPSIRAISFTGGTQTGRRIQEIAAQTNKKISLELGGKNAAIIFADCDLPTAITTSLRSAFANQGEICLCTSKILVEASIFDQFLEKFAKATSQLIVDDPFNPDTFMGALISPQHLSKVESYIEMARAEGCRIVYGGQRPANLESGLQSGNFLQPTIISNVKPNSRLMTEEIFGPVVCVAPFSDEEDGIRLANDTEYGLAATVWTKDIQKAQRVASSLEVGTVWVNCWMLRDLSMPFGGVKASGIGREGGRHSLDFFSESKTVAIGL